MQQDHLTNHARKQLKEQGISTTIKYNPISNYFCTCGNKAVFENPSLCYDCLDKSKRRCRLGNNNLHWIKNKFICIDHIGLTTKTVNCTCLGIEYSLATILSIRSEIVKEVAKKILLLKGFLVDDITTEITKVLISVMNIGKLYITK